MHDIPLRSARKQLTLARAAFKTATGKVARRTMRRALVGVSLLATSSLVSLHPVHAQEKPTFSCGFLGPPADSGIIITGSNPVLVPQGEEGASKAWRCTVTCVFRTSDEREFSAFTCTERVRLGAEDEEICRDGPDMVGAPFSEAVISNSSCE